MADQQDLKKRIGLTPGKAVLISVLAVVLVSVVYVQYGPGGVESAEEVVEAVEVTSERAPSPTPATATPIRPQSVAAPTIASAPAADDAVSGEKRPVSPMLDAERWKAPDVDRVVEYDPFALPSAFPHPVNGIDEQGLTSEGIVAADAATRASQLADEVAKLHTELESLRQRGVSVIVKQHDKYVAMIGDRTVHVGDEIGSGFTVTAIDPDGVRVEKKVEE